jgi:hypothetical protein
MRIAYDNKSHKRALRDARRSREMARLAPLQRDVEAPAPSRKAIRYGAPRMARSIAYAMLALALIASTPRHAFAWSHGGASTSRATYHAKAEHTRGGNGDARGNFHAFMTGGK